MSAGHPTRSLVIGSTLVAVGIFVNKWTLAPLAGDGVIDGARGLLVLLVLQIPCALLGVLFILRPDIGALKRIPNAVLGVAALAYSVVLVEVMLRAVPGTPIFQPNPREFVGEHADPHGKHFMVDRLTGWRMLGHTSFRWKVDDHWNDYRANRQGFRSDSDYVAAGDRRLIAVVGDSFAFGTGVEAPQTFASLLERGLEGRASVYNFALPGFALDQMWMSVRHRALPIGADLVVVAFIDEDLDRSLTAFRAMEGFNKPTFELDGGRLRPQTPADRANVVVRSLERYSALWTAFRLGVREVGYRAPFGAWWLRNEAILRAIIADCASASVPVVFVRLPMKNWKPFPNLQRFMESEGAELIDLGDARARPSYQIHFERDGHINAEGHKFVAAALTNWLERTE